MKQKNEEDNYQRNYSSDSAGFSYEINSTGRTITHYLNSDRLIHFSAETMSVHGKYQSQIYKVWFSLLRFSVNHKNWRGGPQDIHLCLRDTVANSKERKF